MSERSDDPTDAAGKPPHPLPRLRPSREPPATFSVPKFCEWFDVGRTFTYDEIGAGRLISRKAGRRTLIAYEDARAWFNALPRSQKAKAGR